MEAQSASSAAYRLHVPLRPGETSLLLAGIALAMYVLCLAFAYFLYVQEYRSMIHFFRLFNLNAESNVTTWFSSSVILANAGLLYLIYRAVRNGDGRFAYHWAFLALVVLGLSIDETAMIHETLATRTFRHAVGETSHLLVPEWVFVLAPLALLFALAYIPFLSHLPRRTMILFVSAGAIYVGGALGMEALSGYVATRLLEPQSLPYVLFNSVEEMGEIAGQILFGYALLSYLADRVGGLSLAFVPAGDARRRRPVTAPSLALTSGPRRTPRARSSSRV